MKSSFRFFLIFASILVCACSPSEIRDISNNEHLSKIIGSEYRIVKSIYAYGIYGDLDKKIVTNVSLISDYQISGREIAFERKIERGQTLKIVGVEQWVGPFSSSIVLRVELPEVELGSNAPISIQLPNAKLGVGIELDPKLYERIVK